MIQETVRSAVYRLAPPLKDLGEQLAMIMRHTARREQERSALKTIVLTVMALLIALGIFALDVLSPLQGAVAVLYTIVVVIAARSGTRRLVLLTGGLCVTLAGAGFVISHGDTLHVGPVMRLCVSIVAISLTSLLCASQIAATRARRRADLRYATIFEAAGFPIWESDWSAALQLFQRDPAPGPDAIRQATTRSRVRNANLQAAKLFGYRHGRDMVGSSIARHYTGGAEAAQAQVFRALLAGEMPVEVEAGFVTLTGQTVELMLRISLPAEARGWESVLVTAVDVTERNRTQKRLAAAQAELAHMARVTTLGQIAASIAHEVNQPLSAVVTYAKAGRRWLTREAPDAAEVADCLEQIEKNGVRSAEVIAGIQALARKADPKSAPVLLARVLSETVAILTHEFAAAGVRVRIDLPDDLPAVRADRVQIQQVMMNLLLNAAQAMVDTPPEKRLVEVRARRLAGFVETEFADHGSGLRGQAPECLFMPFFTTREEGMGMGLTICRSIVEQHGGTLVASENASGGLSMRLRLPVSAPGGADWNEGDENG